HRVIEPTVVLTDVVDGDDVGVRDPGHRPRLAQQPIGRRVGVAVREHDLQTDEPPEADIARLVHDPHAARPQTPDDRVPAYAGAGWQLRMLSAKRLRSRGLGGE